MCAGAAPFTKVPPINSRSHSRRAAIHVAQPFTSRSHSRCNSRRET
jgi:hypothetical protein